MWSRNGVKGHTLIRGIDYKRIDKLNGLEAVLKARYDKLLDLQTEIEEWINTIERSDIRQIIEYRYIDNMNWYQIQTIMKYDHEDVARRKCERFLEKN